MEKFKYDLKCINDMKREVSDRIVIILLVVAILVSLGGAVLIYDHIDGLRSDFDNKLNNGLGGSTGMVALNVVDDFERGESVESNE